MREFEVKDCPFCEKEFLITIKVEIKRNKPTIPFPKTPPSQTIHEGFDSIEIIKK